MKIKSSIIATAFFLLSCSTLKHNNIEKIFFFKGAPDPGCDFLGYVNGSSNGSNLDESLNEAKSKLEESAANKGGKFIKIVNYNVAKNYVSLLGEVFSCQLNPKVKLIFTSEKLTFSELEKSF